MRTVVAAVAVIFSVAGCSFPAGKKEGKPQVVYNSGGEQPTEIIVNTTVNQVISPITPEGSKVVNGTYDYRYSLRNPDRTTTELPFLNSQENLPNGQGYFTKFFRPAGIDGWVACGTDLGKYRLGYGPGWFEYGMVNTELTVKLFVKSFTKQSLIKEAKLEVCNPANLRNPALQYDESLPAIRYCGKSGTSVYYPLTGAIRNESSSPCCEEIRTDNYAGKRKIDSYFEKAVIRNP